jgi:hypothetical protein
MTTAEVRATNPFFPNCREHVDENGKPVSVETVKSGVPVTVYFTREGVRKASPPAGVIIQKKTTTVTEESK